MEEYTIELLKKEKRELKNILYAFVMAAYGLGHLYNIKKLGNRICEEDLIKEVDTIIRTCKSELTARLSAGEGLQDSLYLIGSVDAADDVNIVWDTLYKAIKND